MQTENIMSSGQVKVLARPTQETSSPTNASIVSVQATDNDVDLWLTPATGISALTVTLPSGGYIGQVVTIGTSQPITLLTINGAPSILNPVNTLLGGDTVQLKRINSTTWTRLL